MAGPVIVRIALDADPRFPKNCVVCRTAWPEHTLTVSRRREGVLNAFGLLPLGRRHSFAVPTCRSCAKRLSRRHRTDALLTILGGVAAAAVGLVAHRVWRMSLTWAFIAAAAVLTIALTLRQFFAAPAFDFTVEGDHLDFEFASAEYAAVFHTQNTILGISGVSQPF